MSLLSSSAVDSSSWCIVVEVGRAVCGGLGVGLVGRERVLASSGAVVIGAPGAMDIGVMALENCGALVWGMGGRAESRPAMIFLDLQLEDERETETKIESGRTKMRSRGAGGEGEACFVHRDKEEPVGNTPFQQRTFDSSPLLMVRIIILNEATRTTIWSQRRDYSARFTRVELLCICFRRHGRFFVITTLSAGCSQSPAQSPPSEISLSLSTRPRSSTFISGRPGEVQ